MSWIRLNSGDLRWINVDPGYCWCCKAKPEHCYCSRHVGENGGNVCLGCMKHDVAVVDKQETLLNGDVLIRKVKQHVCPPLPA